MGKAFEGNMLGMFRGEACSAFVIQTSLNCLVDSFLFVKDVFELVRVCYCEYVCIVP